MVSIKINKKKIDINLYVNFHDKIKDWCEKWAIGKNNFKMCIIYSKNIKIYHKCINGIIKDERIVNNNEKWSDSDIDYSKISINYKDTDEELINVIINLNNWCENWAIGKNNYEICISYSRGINVYRKCKNGILKIYCKVNLTTKNNIDISTISVVYENKDIKKCGAN